MQLNLEQRRAIASNHRRIGVVAGAGTGKTAVLTERVLALIRGGTDPRRILVCTFTEKAAFELRDRVAQAARTAGVSRTYFYEIIKKYGVK